MTRWCPDANVIIASVLAEEHSAMARQFWATLNDADEVIAPHILFPECTSVLRRRVFRGDLTEEEGYSAVEFMLGLPIRVEPWLDQFRLAFDWATRMRRAKTNDLQYVAAAQIMNATIVSLDGGMRHAAIEHQVPIRLLR